MDATTAAAAPGPSSSAPRLRVDELLDDVANSVRRRKGQRKPNVDCADAFFFFSSSVVVIRASAFFFSAPVVPCSLFDSSNRLDGDAASLCQRERNRGAKFLPETCRKRRRRRRSRRSTMTSCGGGGKKNQLSPPFYLSLPRLLHSRRSSQINDYVNDGFDAFDK